MSEIAERVIVITGGYGGIGRVTALALAQQGAKVVITGKDTAKGQAAAEKLSEEGGRLVHFLPLDVTDSAAVSKSASQVESEIGPVYGLVANAGIAKLGSAFEYSDKDWRETLSVNLDGTFYCAREFGRFMRGRGGSIVLVSSIAAHAVLRPETHVAYGVSKAGISHLATLLATEWAPEGIRVNAIAPGYTETEILARIRTENPEGYAAWMHEIPAKRLLWPEEIASVINFLLSDASSAITGAKVVADGGYLRH